MVPQQGVELERLLTCADAALYRAKAGGKARAIFCTDDDSASVDLAAFHVADGRCARIGPQGCKAQACRQCAERRECDVERVANSPVTCDDLAIVGYQDRVVNPKRSIDAAISFNCCLEWVRALRE